MRDTAHVSKQQEQRPPPFLHARHVAYAAIGGIEVVVTLNLKHLANEWSERRVNSVNLREGYTLLSIRTPEEVIRYGN